MIEMQNSLAYVHGQSARSTQQRNFHCAPTPINIKSIFPVSRISSVIISMCVCLLSQVNRVEATNILKMVYELVDVPVFHFILRTHNTCSLKEVLLGR